MFLHHLSAQVMGLYAELDAQVALFRSVSGLQCPAGCGTCCQSSKVEATVLELIPLAIRLMGSDTCDQLLGYLSQTENRSGTCLLCDPKGDKGHCSVYEHRGIVCRLFGFAGNRDRQQLPQLAACRVMRAEEPALFPRAAALLELEPGLLPLFSEWGMRLTAIDPALGTRRLPINEALYEALVKVESMRLYMGTVNLETETSEETGLLEDGLESHGPFPGEFGDETGTGGVQ
nr:YkgJ family cysteine cluster protein [uncultured Desulfobulbus sp.]